MADLLTLVLFGVRVHPEDPPLTAPCRFHLKFAAALIIRAMSVRQVRAHTDALARVPRTRGARVNDLHRLVLHCICDGVDAQLLGSATELETAE